LFFAPLAPIARILVHPASHAAAGFLEMTGLL